MVMHKLTEDGRVIVFIRLDQDVERMLSGDSEPFLRDREPE